MTKSLSVITICKDNEKDLFRTLLSIKSQITLPQELVIVDSSDVPLYTISLISSLLEHLETQLVNIVYDKFPPSGISSAFNRGVSLASSEHLLFLNSGDMFFGCNSMNVIYSSITSAHDIHSFGCVTVDSGDKNIRASYPCHSGFLIHPLYYKNCFPHPSTVFKKSSLLRCGGYDQDLSQCMDYDLYIRLVLLHKVPVSLSSSITSVFYAGGTSSDFLNLLGGLRECWSKYKHYSFYPNSVVRLFLQLRLFLYSHLK